MTEPCKHVNLDASVTVLRYAETPDGRASIFNAHVRVECHECKRPFQFLSLPYGDNPRTATRSMDAQQARLAIVPSGGVALKLVKPA